MKVSQALLLHLRDQGAIGPGQLDAWLKLMHDHGLIESELRSVGGYNLPHWVITDKGLEHLVRAGL